MELLTTQFVTIAAAHLLAVVSPGPDFAVTVRQSVSFGAKNGIFTALGIATGICLHSAYIVLGLGLLLKDSPTLFMIMKYIGAAYLVYLGISSLRSKSMPESIDKASVSKKSTLLSAYFTGLLTNALNPKATMFFLSLFTVVVSADTSVFELMFYGGYMAVTTFMWFSFVAYFFNFKNVKEFFLKAGLWFDRLMGILLIIIALTIIFL